MSIPVYPPRSIWDEIHTADESAWGTLRVVIESPLLSSSRFREAALQILRLHCIFWEYKQDLRNGSLSIVAFASDEQKSILYHDLDAFQLESWELYQLAVTHSSSSPTMNAIPLNDNEHQLLHRLPRALKKRGLCLWEDYLMPRSSGIPTIVDTIDLDLYRALLTKCRGLILGVRNGYVKTSRFTHGGKYTTAEEHRDIESVFIQHNIPLNVARSTYTFLYHDLDRYFAHENAMYSDPQPSTPPESERNSAYSRSDTDGPFWSTQTPPSPSQSPPASTATDNYSTRNWPSSSTHYGDAASTYAAYSDDESEATFHQEDIERPRRPYSYQPRPASEAPSNNPGFDVAGYIRERQAQRAARTGSSGAAEAQPPTFDISEYIRMRQAQDRERQPQRTTRSGSSGSAEDHQSDSGLGTSISSSTDDYDAYYESQGSADAWMSRADARDAARREAAERERRDRERAAKQEQEQRRAEWEEEERLRQAERARMEMEERTRRERGERIERKRDERRDLRRRLSRGQLR